MSDKKKEGERERVDEMMTTDEIVFNWRSFYTVAKSLNYLDDELSDK